MARLRRADCSGPGITRMRRGRGFSYLDEDGDPLEEPDVVQRIRALGIPPAWKEVWICPDDRGHIHFVGRMKEMIRTGGINVAPAEIEAFLTTHPAVRQAVVVGLPDREKDEVVGALVQLEPGASVSEQELRAYCRARIAAFKVPRRIRFVSEDDIPRTSTGKVNKQGIADLIG